MVTEIKALTLMDENPLRSYTAALFWMSRIINGVTIQVRGILLKANKEGGGIDS